MKNLIERIEARLDDWGAKLEKKNIEYPVDLICGILFLVIGIVLLLIMPQQVQISEKDVVNGRAFPTMLVWLMLAMSALLVGREAYNMVMHRPVKTKKLNLLVEAKKLWSSSSFWWSPICWRRSQTCLWWVPCSARWPSCCFSVARSPSTTPSRSRWPY